MSGTDDVINNAPNVAGFQVQMCFWALIFARKGWNVYSFSKKRKGVLSGIHYIYHDVSKVCRKLHLTFLSTLAMYVKAFLVRPDYVFCRGFSNGLHWVTTICRFLGVKTVFFGASDVNFIPGKELPTGDDSRTRNYRKGLKKVDYFVTQNEAQHGLLLSNYERDSIIIPNIWIPQDDVSNDDKKYDAVWVSNLRKLKRPEWFLDMATANPNSKYAMAGGGRLDKDFYDSVEQQASQIPNLDFLGPLSFNEVSKLMAKAKVVVCSSEFEGFPNTFLQAWSLSVPVVSTVDPSGVIERYSLGFYVQDKEEMISKSQILANDKLLNHTMSENVNKYFISNHSADNGYEKIIKLILN